jgi:hypothetical protein
VAAILSYIAQALAATVVAVLIGYLPTLHLGGPAALPGLVAGCVIGMAASLAGAGPMFVEAARGATSLKPAGIMMGTVLRLVTAALLGAIAVATGRFEKRSLLLWIALSYLLNLAVEVRYATRSFPRDAKKRDVKR